MSLGHAGDGGGSATRRLWVGSPMSGSIILRRRRPSRLAQARLDPGVFGCLGEVILQGGPPDQRQKNSWDGVTTL